MRRHKPRFSTKDYHNCVRLFALRLLVCKQIKGVKLNHHLYHSDELRELVAPSIEEDAVRNMDNATLRAYLSEQLQTLETSGLGENLLSDKSPLGCNIGYLAEMLGLDDSAPLVLAFCWLAVTNNVLDDLLDFILKPGTTVAEILSAALNIRPHAISAVIARDAPLVSVRIITLKSGRRSWSSNVTLPDYLVDVLGDEFSTPEAFYAQFLNVSPPCNLTRDDFPHLVEDFKVLLPFLRNALASRVRGVNVLIYGEPGTGKSQFARILAAELGCQMYEVPSEGGEGRSISADDRLTANVFCQQLLKSVKNTLLMFDEAENAFSATADSISWLFQSASDRDKSNKPWLNALLENNPVPTLWISNHIYGIDKAFLRRFDYVMELGMPPRSIRRRIAEKHLGDLPVSAAWLDRLAENAHLSPALLEKSSRVLAISGVLDQQEAEAHLSRVIDNRLRLVGSELNDMAYWMVTTFEPAIINANTDLTELTEAIHRHPCINLCLYGPPGTGKTAYGHYLAEQLDRPVILMTASDLLSKWVGETEKAMAAMFRQAADEKAVLILDEADSFLRDRTTAQHSWEVTQVNVSTQTRNVPLAAKQKCPL